MKYTKIICVGCGKETQKPKKEIDRQISKGKEKFYCSKRCCNIYAIRPNRIHKEIEVNCIICGKSFTTSTKKRAAKTCSIQCAGRYSVNNLTEEQKNLKSEKIRNFNLGKTRIKVERLGAPRVKKDKRYFYELTGVCVICNREFKTLSQNPSKKNKTCGKECRKIHQGNLARSNPNCGGETNYKRYKYQDIIMDSSWEVELAQWMDEKNIKWIRSRKICLYWKDEKDELRRYYPDFYLPDYNVYLDPKNKYLQQKDEFKLQRVVEHQNIKLFSGFLDEIKEKVLNILIPH